VFVIASARAGFDPAAVLLEFEGVRRDTPPRRETRQDTATHAASGAHERRSHWDGAEHPHPTLNQSFNTGAIGYSNQELFSQRGAGLVGEASTGEISHCLNAGGMGRQDYETETLVTHALRGEGFDASEDGTGRGTPLVPVGIFQDSEFGVQQYDSAGTLRAGRIPEHQMVMQPVAFAQNTRDEVRLQGGDGQIVGALAAQPGMKQTTYVAQAVSLRGRDGGGTAELGGDIQNALRASQGGGDKPHVLAQMAVRRLTPVECERLQGFPDSYTMIPWKKKPADQCPDGPRYKALGNSMAVPCMRWIGRRIANALA